MNPRRSGFMAALTACSLAAGLLGCSGGGSGSQQQSQGGGIFALFAPKKDPNKDLTVDEGQKLLVQIRKNPKRMEKLTPAERRFLAKAVVASEAAD